MHSTAPGLRIPHVLVVEDHADERDLYQYLLTRQGYRISEAADGFEALASIESDRPDLILTDLGLPSMDGFEFCETLRRVQSTSDIPIIVVTGLPHTADVTHLVACGARVLRKPCSPMALSAAVEQALQARARLRPLVGSAAVRARVMRRRATPVPRGESSNPSRVRLHRHPWRWQLLVHLAARHFIARPDMRMTVSQAAKIWGVTPTLAGLTCEYLCRRGVLVMSSTGVFRQRAGAENWNIEHG
jgi:CheY-like chemotaxis protein